MGNQHCPRALIGHKKDIPLNKSVPIAQTVAKLALVIGVLLGLSHLVGAWVATLDLKDAVGTTSTVRMGIWMTAMVYAALLAVPFVPGIEIGIGLMAMFGAASALPVYVATVLGLSAAFITGRLVPVSALIRVAATLRMRRLAVLLRRMDGLPNADRLEVLTQSAPGVWGPWLIRNRYIALVILVNLPGNVFIGGGGGIALAAGLCRLFSPVSFFVTIALAVSPVPLAVGLFGADVLDALS